MSRDQSADLLVTRQDGIVTATLNRPQARNALTYAMYDGLAALCTAIDGETETNVLIVTGAGPEAFAAGTDIAQFKSLASAEDSLAYEARIERVLGAIERCRVPTIAALAGACTGGGAAIAGCCDLRIAAANLRYGFPIARTLGNGLSAQNLYRLVALMGEARVKEMIFTARLIGAEEAHAIGLVSAIVADAGDLPARATALAQTIAAHAPLTLRATKQALLRLRPRVDPADHIVQLCYLSHDFKEGVAAFGEKRTPRWEGR
jgi:enoyl-CoA hydratase